MAGALTPAIAEAISSGSRPDAVPEGLGVPALAGPDQSGDKGPAVGAPSEAPTEYHALVDEYRSLARDKKPNPRP